MTYDCDFIIDEIKKFEFKNKETDVVVISFDMDKFNIDDVRQIAETVTSAFAGHIVGFIPKGMEVEIKDIDSMIQYLEDIKKDYPVKLC